MDDSEDLSQDLCFQKSNYLTVAGGSENIVPVAIPAHHLTTENARQNKYYVIVQENAEGANRGTGSPIPGVSSAIPTYQVLEASRSDLFTEVSNEKIEEDALEHQGASDSIRKQTAVVDEVAVGGSGRHICVTIPMQQLSQSDKDQQGVVDGFRQQTADNKAKLNAAKGSGPRAASPTQEKEKLIAVGGRGQLIRVASSKRKQSQLGLEVQQCVQPNQSVVADLRKQRRPIEQIIPSKVQLIAVGGSGNLVRAVSPTQQQSQLCVAGSSLQLIPAANSKHELSQLVAIRGSGQCLTRELSQLGLLSDNEEQETQGIQQRVHQNHGVVVNLQKQRRPIEQIIPKGDSGQLFQAASLTREQYQLELTDNNQEQEIQQIENHQHGAVGGGRKTVDTNTAVAAVPGGLIQLIRPASSTREQSQLELPDSNQEQEIQQIENHQHGAVGGGRKTVDTNTTVAAVPGGLIQLIRPASSTREQSQLELLDSNREQEIQQIENHQHGAVGGGRKTVDTNTTVAAVPGGLIQLIRPASSTREQSQLELPDSNREQEIQQIENHQHGAVGGGRKTVDTNTTVVAVPGGFIQLIRPASSTREQSQLELPDSNREQEIQQIENHQHGAVGGGRKTVDTNTTVAAVPGGLIQLIRPASSTREQSQLELPDSNREQEIQQIENHQHGAVGGGRKTVDTNTTVVAVPGGFIQLIWPASSTREQSQLELPDSNREQEIQQIENHQHGAVGGGRKTVDTNTTVAAVPGGLIQLIRPASSTREQSQLELPDSNREQEIQQNHQHGAVGGGRKTADTNTTVVAVPGGFIQLIRPASSTREQSQLELPDSNREQEIQQIENHQHGAVGGGRKTVDTNTTVVAVPGGFIQLIRPASSTREQSQLELPDSNREQEIQQIENHQHGAVGGGRKTVDTNTTVVAVPGGFIQLIRPASSTREQSQLELPDSNREQEIQQIVNHQHGAVGGGQKTVNNIVLAVTGGLGSPALNTDLAILSTPGPSQSTGTQQNTRQHTSTNQQPPVFDPSYLETLLSQDLEGQQILIKAKQGELSDKKQRNLAKVVARYHVAYKSRLTKEDLELYTLAITTLFPHERKETYFIPRGGSRKNHGGKIANKIGNYKQASKTEEEKENAHTNILNGDEESDTDGINEETKWLLANRVPWTTVLDRWPASFVDRNKYLRNAKQVPKLLKDYAHYKDPFGYQLVDLDFACLFPDAPCGIDRLNSICSELRPYIDKRATDPSKIRLLQLLESDDNNTKVYSLILIISTILPPISAGRKYKSTIIGAQDDCVLIASNDVEAREKVGSLYVAYAEQGFPLVPKLVFLGSGPEDFAGEFIVYYNDVHYTVESAARALDVLIKLTAIFGLPYSKISRLVWQFISGTIYGLEQKESYNAITKVDRFLQKRAQ